MTRASALLFLLRRERSELAALGSVALLVAFTAFVSVAGIRLLERAGDDGLRRAVAAAPVVQRTIRFAASRTLFERESARTMADWQAEGQQLRSTLPEQLREFVGEGNLAIGSVRLRVANPPDFPIFTTLRYQDGFHELVELVSGRWPASTNEQLPPVAEFPATDEYGFGWPVGTDHSSDDPRRFEIAVQDTTARELGLEIGSRLSVALDLVDPMLTSSMLRQADLMLAPTELEITGVYRIPDPEADGWFGDPRLQFDDLGNTGTDVNQSIAYISAYVPPDAVPGLVTSGLPFQYQWRFPILVDRLDADSVDEIERDLRALESQPAGTDASHEVTAEAGLLPLLERHSAMRAASERVLALAGSAPLALAAAAVAMAAVLLTGRRRAAMILARGRGAPGLLLLLASLVEAVLVAVLACLAGLGLAIALEPTAALEPSVAAAVSIGMVAVLVLAGAAWTHIRQPLRDVERVARPARRMDPRRLVAEISVVAFALVGAYVLRQRGVASASGQFDPFLAAVPPLMALAAGIVVVRLYPPLMTVAGWFADRRRDLVAVLGARAIARGASSTLPALVLVLAAAFAAFSSIVSTSVDQAQRFASWVAVGADVRLEPTGSARELPRAFEPDAVAGVTAAARGLIDPGVRAPNRTATGTLVFHAVDAGAYETAVAGSPIEPKWPPEFGAEPADSPIPAIVATRLTGGEARLGEGDTLDINVLGRRVQLEIVEVRAKVPGITTGDSFTIVPFAWLEHALGRELPESMMWMRIAPDDVAALEEHSADAGGIRLVSRYDEYRRLRDEPLVGAVGVGFALAFGVSVGYAALTILGALILSVGRQTRDLAVLRTLGLDRRQATLLTIAEHVPTILVALLPGLALGIGVAVAIAPGLRLGAFSGSAGDVPLVIDGVALAVLAVALAGLALSAVAVGSWLSRRAAIINALRMTSD